MITLSLVSIKHPPLHGPKYVTIPLLKHGFLDFLVLNILWGKEVSQLISGSKPITVIQLVWRFPRISGYPSWMVCVTSIYKWMIPSGKRLQKTMENHHS